MTNTQKQHKAIAARIKRARTTLMGIFDDLAALSDETTADLTTPIPGVSRAGRAANRVNKANGELSLALGELSWELVPVEDEEEYE